MKPLASILLLCLLILALAMTGCETMLADEQGTSDTRAWNSPAGWEGQMLGVPY